MNKVKPLHRFIRAFVLRRAHSNTSVTLTQNRIFILPTLSGMAFLLTACLVLILAVNYQNNLSYAVCFFMFSLFITAMIHTYANISGLKIDALQVQPVFPEESIGFRYRLQSPRPMYQISMGFEGGVFTSPLDSGVDTATEMTATEVTVVDRAIRRGWQPAPLMQITSKYPLGLFKVWSWVKLEHQALVYPAPIHSFDLDNLSGDQSGNSPSKRQGEADFSELKRYQAGESIHRIAWKTYAKGQGVFIKTYQGDESRGVWLDLSQSPDLALEDKLSGFCYWALQLSQEQVPFGLKLDSLILPPEADKHHCDAVLRELALYGHK